MPLESLLKGIRKTLFFSVLGAAGICGMSCAMNISGPGGRIGCLPSPTLLTKYLGEDAWKYETGIAFTRKYGHIDLSHLRNCMEYTEYFTEMSLRNLRERKREFSFYGREPVLYNVKIVYPPNWANVEESSKQEIFEEAALELGAYLSSKVSIWHEILTWFNWRSTLIVDERASAFSWEDLPSNMLGCYVGKLALRDRGHSFKDAANIILQQEFERLEIQPRSVNAAVIKSVEGIWYKKKFPDAVMLRRNLDIGARDKKVSPSIPPGYECKEVWECPVPAPDSLREAGFNIEIRLRTIAKKEKISQIIGKNGVIDIETDFPRIMGHIRKEAVEKGYIIND